MIVPQWIIEKKRDGTELSYDEIDAFVQGYNSGEIPDYQMAALAMAIYLKGMTVEEVGHLTMSMMNTGRVLDTSGFGRHVSDKHSTGGIGDKTSLILAPLVACNDIAVPMISGRGLGITGGTLDKLESIPGYNTQLSESDFLRIVDEVGCSIIGQTDQLAPADKKLYALRDVTATVPSIPLITASIMCKKMAEGLDSLVLDVKAGRGAFMRTVEDAEALAASMIRVGEAMGKTVRTRINDMNVPLGRCIGNAVEVQECIQVLRGEIRDGALVECTLQLCADMLIMGGQAESEAQALSVLREQLASGAALQKFSDMLKAQGGDRSVLENGNGLPQASHVLEVRAETGGSVVDVDAEAFGRAVLVLGGGRRKSDDPVDHAVGISELVSIGESVENNGLLYLLHFNDPAKAEEAGVLLSTAIQLSN